MTLSSKEIVRGLNKIEDEETRKVCLNKPTRDECIRWFILFMATGWR